MSCESIAAKIKQSLYGNKGPVVILLLPTPAKNSVTIRCLPVSRFNDALNPSGKWAKYYLAGVYTPDIPPQWIRDDIEFAFLREEMFSAFEF